MKKRITRLKRIYLAFAVVFTTHFLSAQTTVITGPTGSGQFGKTITVLTNGNYVVTDPLWDNGAIADVGAVYLYNGATHALISTITGSTASDQVGNGGVTALSNGNFVVRSIFWDNGAASNAGAVTWGNGSTGVSGVVSSSNSLVGSSSNDQVGTVTALANGNYVIGSSLWDNGASGDVGAVTWGNGSAGISGVISSSNSLIGSVNSDQIGNSGVTTLPNGNYLVKSTSWHNGAINSAGAVTWSNGSTGITGVISSSNSLVGSTSLDQVGIGGVIILANNNYLVISYNWDYGATQNVGAATWGSGTAGVTGTISSSNSLIGSSLSDQIGSTAVSTLSNGNYIIVSQNWDNATISNAGAVTWGNGTTGTSGVISSSNSLVGSTASDQIGSVTVLSNGNYVVRSANWDDGATADVGAATWGSGTSGISGVISSSNSLIGSKLSDKIGGTGIIALSNGNYIAISPNWDNGAVTDVGAVTWGNGSTGTTGTVSSSNSLVGSTAGDAAGNGNVTVLTNGNYVVKSTNWDNGAIVDAGAATWGNGTTGISGAISSSNSLVGSTTTDQISNYSVTALSNGNYVVMSITWDDGAIADAGAVTWGSGTSGISGAVSSSNSLVGSTASDGVGNNGVTALTNGNYVVKSTSWDNGATINTGAITWGNGTTGIAGIVSSSNSLVGTTANDAVGSTGVTPLSNGNFVVVSLSWDNGAVTNAGAVTWGDGTTGTAGAVSSTNSLVGSTASDAVGTAITALNNGNYVVKSSNWDNGALNGAGAVSFGNGSVGVTGVISSCNSVRGAVTNAGAGYTLAYNSTYVYEIVGSQVENIVTVFNPNGQSLGVHLDAVTQTLSGPSPTAFVNSSCRIISSVLPNGAVPVSGSITAKMWVESTQPSQYLKRHYEITPASNASTATGRVTLYFTQQEFDDFNAVNAAKLPANPSDASGKANVLLEKRPGTSSDGTGLPATYTGTPANLDPNDADIVWNNLLSRWEVSFDVTGFSGFFVKTISGILPLRWIQVSGTLNEKEQAIIRWKVQERNVADFTLQKSSNGSEWNDIGTAVSKGIGTNSYMQTDAQTLEGTGYYRIRENELNGSYSYSSIVRLSNSVAPEMSLYPNPAQDVVTLSAGKGLMNTIATLSDSRGVVLKQIQINGMQTKIDIKSLPQGIYLLKTSNGDTRKLVKE